MRIRWIGTTLLLGSLVASLGVSAQNNNNAAKQQTKSHFVPPEGDEGERIFQQNCARCHNPPDGFSPRISATIVRHMRVRASLSRHDEQLLLRFLNP